MSATEADSPETTEAPAVEPAGPQEPAQEPAEAPGQEPDDDEPETGTEPDQGDSGQDEEQEAEETPGQGQSAEAFVAAMDKRMTALARRGANYADAVVEFVQETEQPILRCGFCMDALPGFLPSPAVQPFTPIQLSYARDVLGMPDEPPYVQGQDAHTCPDCDGWGQVLTGSKRNDQKTRKCFTCNGIGWEGRGAGDAAPQNGAANLTIVQPPEQAPPDVEAHDPWGRPVGHPGYGILPTPGLAAHLLPAGMSQPHAIG